MVLMTHGLCFPRCLVCFLALSVDVHCWHLVCCFERSSFSYQSLQERPACDLRYRPLLYFSSLYLRFVFHLILLTFPHRFFSPLCSAVSTPILTSVSVAFVSVRFSSSPAVPLGSSGFFPPFPKNGLKHGFCIFK